MTIRAMRASDIPAILGIENASFASPWTEREFSDFLKSKNCGGLVAFHVVSVLGFAVYERRTKIVHLRSLAVGSLVRRTGVGAAIVSRVKQICKVAGRNAVIAEVAEPNLPGQLFFKSQGFRCVETVPEFFQGGLDAYRFRWPPQEGQEQNHATYAQPLAAEES